MKEIEKEIITKVYNYVLDCGHENKTPSNKNETLEHETVCLSGKLKCWYDLQLKEGEEAHDHYFYNHEWLSLESVVACNEGQDDFLRKEKGRKKFRLFKCPNGHNLTSLNIYYDEQEGWSKDKIIVGYDVIIYCDDKKCEYNGVEFYEDYI